MPLRKLSIPEYVPACKLTAAQAAAAFFTGCLFVLAPVPQLLVQKSSTLALLISSSVSPIAGILVMSLMLYRFGGYKALQLKRISRQELKECCGWTAVIILCYTLINALWKFLLQTLHIPFEENQQLMYLAEQCNSIEFFFFALLVMVPVPIAEELLFRRIIFDGLLPMGKWSAMIISSVFFAAAHLFLAGLPGLFVIAIGFQWIFLKQKNLLASIICHALLNGVSVIAVLLAPPTGN